jgi:hypothetical protein
LRFIPWGISVLLFLFYWKDFLNSNYSGPEGWDWEWFGYYLADIHYSINTENSLPHFTNSVIQKTIFFHLNGETPVYSPFVTLSYLFDFKNFTKMFVILNLFIGIIGYWFMCSQAKIEGFLGLIFFPVVFCSGFLSSRVFIGHLSLIYAIWFPWIIGFLIHYQRKKIDSIIYISMIISIILYSGGIHVVLWFLAIVLVYILFFSNDFIKNITYAIAFIFLFFVYSGLRLIPMINQYSSYEPKILNGFLNLYELIQAFVESDIPWNYARHYHADYHPIMQWELYFYIGWFGFVFIIWGLSKSFKKFSNHKYMMLFFAISILILLLSWRDNTIQLAEWIPLSILKTQRHTTRWMILSIILLCLISMKGLERKNTPLFIQIIYSIIAVILVLDYRNANRQWIQFNSNGLVSYERIEKEILPSQKLIQIQANYEHSPSQTFSLDLKSIGIEFKGNPKDFPSRIQFLSWDSKFQSSLKLSSGEFLPEKNTDGIQIKMAKPWIFVGYDSKLDRIGGMVSGFGWILSLGFLFRSKFRK